MSGFWSPGADGIDGANGQTGGVVGEYTLNNTAAGAPPGSGFITADALLATATQIFISYFDRNGNDLTAWVSHFQVGDTLRVMNDQGTGQYYSTITSVTQTGSGATGYVTYGVDPTTTIFVAFPNNDVAVAAGGKGVPGKTGGLTWFWNWGQAGAGLIDGNTYANFSVNPIGTGSYTIYISKNDLHGISTAPAADLSIVVGTQLRAFLPQIGTDDRTIPNLYGTVTAVDYTNIGGVNGYVKVTYNITSYENISSAWTAGPSAMTNPILAMSWGIPGVTGNPGAPGSIGEQGPEGDMGLPGARGLRGVTGGVTLFYKYDSSNTTTPGAGYISFNSNTLGSVTDIYINTVDREAQSMATILAQIAAGTPFGDWLKVFDEDKVSASNAPLVYVFGNVATVALAGSVYHFNIGNLQVPASGSFTNNDNVAFTFSEKGETGATGATGAIGAVGPQGIDGVDGDQGPIGPIGPQGLSITGRDGPPGLDGVDGEPGPNGVAGPQGTVGGWTIVYVYDTGTVYGGQPLTSGRLAFDNSSPGSATTIFASDNDAYGTSVATILATMSNGDSVRIFDILTGKTYFFYTLNGAASHDIDHYDLIVTNTAASTPVFSAGQQIGLGWVKRGAAGATGATGATGAAGSPGQTGAPGTPIFLPSEDNSEPMIFPPGGPRPWIGSKGYKTTDTTVANTTLTTISFNSNVWDFGGVHSTSVNTSRFTAWESGIYIVECCLRYAANSTGYRGAYILKNGTTYIGIARYTNVGADVAYCAVSAVEYMVPGDYIEIQTEQNSGGNLTLTASTTTGTPIASMVKIG